MSASCLVRHSHQTDRVLAIHKQQLVIKTSRNTLSLYVVFHLAVIIYISRTLVHKYYYKYM